MKDSAELLTKTAAALDETPVPANDYRRLLLVHDTVPQPAPTAVRVVPASWRAGLQSSSWQPGSWPEPF